MLKKLAVAVALGAIVGASAAAQSSNSLAGGPLEDFRSYFYGEIGGGYVLDNEFDTLGVLGRFGYETPAPEAFTGLFDRFAYEGELFVGLFGEDDGPDYDYSLGAGLRTIKHLSPRWDGFFRLGLSRVEIEDDGDLDVLFGLGGEYGIDGRSGLRGDLTFQNDLEILSLAYTRDF